MFHLIKAAGLVFSKFDPHIMIKCNPLSCLRCQSDADIKQGIIDVCRILHQSQPRMLINIIDPLIERGFSFSAHKHLN